MAETLTGPIATRSRDAVAVVTFVGDVPSGSLAVSIN